LCPHARPLLPDTQSIAVECGENSAVVAVSSSLFLTLLCDDRADFTLLTEIPDEMQNLLAAQIRPCICVIL
jgi:hypothetical protein